MISKNMIFDEGGASYQPSLGYDLFLEYNRMHEGQFCCTSGTPIMASGSEQ